MSGILHQHRFAALGAALAVGWMAIHAATTNTAEPAARPVAEPPAAVGTNPAGPRVSLKLKDGCVIIGHLPGDHLTFESRIVGRLNIPLERLRSVEFSAGQSPALVSLRNGDSMQLALVDKELRVNTVLGELKVPADHLTAIHFPQAN